MRNMFVVMFIVLALAVVCTMPVSACNQICRYHAGGDSCDTVGWVTGMSCYMSGLNCIDVQELCWTAEAKPADAPQQGHDLTAAMIGLSQPASASQVCLAQ